MKEAARGCQSYSWQSLCEHLCLFPPIILINKLTLTPSVLGRIFVFILLVIWRFYTQKLMQGLKQYRLWPLIFRHPQTLPDIFPLKLYFNPFTTMALFDMYSCYLLSILYIETHVEIKIVQTLAINLLISIDHSQCH